MRHNINIIRDEETAKVYSYYAFISYKSEDEKWARWLQEQIEKYKLPSRLVNEKQTASKVYPVFRYVTDLTPGVLNDGLVREVASSKFLIVICSKNMQNKADYINFEIKAFLENGGSCNRILPFIVDGEVNSSNPTEECYPQALLELGEKIPQGVNLKMNTKQDAYLKIIASMLSIKFSELKDRDIERRKKKIRIAAGIMAVLLIMVTVIGVNHWRYYMPSTRYYADYIERYGVAEGIFELDKKDLKGRYGYYAITSQEGLVRELRYESRTGKLRKSRGIQELVSAAKVEYRYFENENSKLKYIDVNGEEIIRKHPLQTAIYYNEKNQKIVVYSYAINQEQITMVLDENDDNAKTIIADLLGGEDLLNSESSKSSITKQKKEYEDGLVSCLYFAQGDYYSPIADTNGIYGYQFMHDEYGRITKKTSLIYDADSKIYSVGEVSNVFQYDSFGNMTLSYLCDSNDVPLMGRGGYSFAMTVFDNNGNGILVSYYGLDGGLIECNDGYASMEAKYDDCGNFVSASYLGLDGNLKKNKQGYAKMKMTYDEAGNYKCIAFLGEDESLVLCDDGYSFANIECDGRGDVTSVSYYGMDGARTLCGNGYFANKVEYDDQGNETSVSYYGTDNNAIICIYGYSVVKKKYDDQGNMISVSFFGTDDEPILADDGYASLEFEYDERGNKIKESIFGTNGMPILCNNGYAFAKMTYDERGNKTSVSYYGELDTPILTIDGYTLLNIEYDNAGYWVSDSYYGLNGELVAYKNGNITQMMTYDDYGNLVTITNYGENNELVLGEEGYAYAMVEYDSDGNQSLVSYYGLNDELVACKDNNVICRMAYDDYGHVVSVAYYGFNDKAVLCENGYASCEIAYDEQGKKKSESYYDLEGNLVLNTFGYASIKWDYDEDGNLIESYYGINDEPVLCENGYASGRVAYDEQGKKKSESYYDLEGDLVVSTWGYASYTMEYDDNGNVISVLYYDAEGNLTTLE